MNVGDISWISLKDCKLCAVQPPVLVNVVAFEDGRGGEILRGVFTRAKGDEAVTITVKAVECHLFYALAGWLAEIFIQARADLDMDVREVPRIPLEDCKLCAVQPPVVVNVVALEDGRGREVVRGVLARAKNDEAVAIAVKAVERQPLHAPPVGAGDGIVDGECSGELEQQCHFLPDLTWPCLSRCSFVTLGLEVFASVCQGGNSIAKELLANPLENGFKPRLSFFSTILSKGDPFSAAILVVIWSKSLPENPLELY